MLHNLTHFIETVKAADAWMTQDIGIGVHIQHTEMRLIYGGTELVVRLHPNTQRRENDINLLQTTVDAAEEMVNWKWKLPNIFLAHVSLKGLVTDLAHYNLFTLL